MTVDLATLKEGDEIPVSEMTPGADHVRNYFANSKTAPPFFFSEEAAKAQGMPGMLVPGPLKVGILYGAVERWLGDAGYVRAIRGAHRRPDVQGRTIQIGGTVARVYEEDGKKRADLELFIVNQDGQPSVRGFGTVEFWDR